jgi:hypothetical protein
MKIFTGVIIGFILAISINVMADNIPSPPPLAGQPAELQHYLESIYVNFHRLPVTTTNPDGSRSGKKGDMVLLITGGNYYLEINVDSSNTWRGVQLLNVP